MLFFKIWLIVGAIYWSLHTIQMVGLRPWAFDALDHVANVIVGLPFCLIFGPLLMIARIASS